MKLFHEFKQIDGLSRQNNFVHCVDHWALIWHNIHRSILQNPFLSEMYVCDENLKVILLKWVSFEPASNSSSSQSLRIGVAWKGWCVGDVTSIIECLKQNHAWGRYSLDPLYTLKSLTPPPLPPWYEELFTLWCATIDPEAGNLF